MRKLRILLVDANAARRDGLRILIDSQADFAVSGSVHTQAAALRVAKTLKPDVVIMGLNTRQGNSLQAAARISRQATPAKVLVLSDRSENASLRQSGEAGVTGYLSRTTTTSNLTQAIREAGRGYRDLVPPSRPTLRPAPSCLAPADPSAAARRITAREVQVLKLIAEGLVNKQIALELSLSIKTVEKHRQALMDKLNIHSIALLTRYAISRHLIPVPEDLD